jgi:hypothetical protein
VAADTIDVTWRGLTLSHEGPYRVADITGWEGTPPARVDDVARPNAHGSFDAPAWSGPRTVVVEGYCISPEERSALLGELGRSMALEGDEDARDLVVAFAGRTLTAHARLTRYGTTLKLWGVGHFGWQAEWWCGDPFRYGAESTLSTTLPEDVGALEFPLFDGTGLLEFGGTLGTTGRLTLTNPGSAPSWPALEAMGPLPSGFEVVEVASGKRLRWPRDVATGSVISLDSRTGSVSIDGTPGYEGYLTRRQWWSVPAGGESTVQFVALGSPDPTALLTATWSATYW